MSIRKTGQGYHKTLKLNRILTFPDQDSFKLSSLQSCFSRTLTPAKQNRSSAPAFGETSNRVIIFTIRRSITIHLNLGLAPQELWNQKAPRLEDSLLAVSLAAIFYPFTIPQKYPVFIESMADTINSIGLSPYSSHKFENSQVFKKNLRPTNK